MSAMCASVAFRTSFKKKSNNRCIAAVEMQGGETFKGKYVVKNST
jgi:hypothetical protein